MIETLITRGRNLASQDWPPREKMEWHVITIQLIYLEGHIYPIPYC
jgi:hypothetical protein